MMSYHRPNLQMERKINPFSPLIEFYIYSGIDIFSQNLVNSKQIFSLSGISSNKKI